MTVATRETKPGTDREPSLSIRIQPDVPTNGTPLSALLSAGIGVFVLGFFTTLAEASANFKNAIVIDKAVGPLSGKTTYAVAAWLAAWAVTYFVMRGKSYAPRPFYIATFVLIGAGFLLTFPLFFDRFAP